MKKQTFGYINDSSYFVVDSAIYGVNLLLSPVFYFQFREAMPVSSLVKARKLAPAILEGKIPQGEYTYYVFPTKEKMVFEIIAFDRGRFEEVLRNSNLQKDRVKNISFASIEIEEEFISKNAGRVIGRENGYFFDIDATHFGKEIDAGDRLLEIISQKNGLKFKISYGSRNTAEKLYETLESSAYYISAALFIVVLSVGFLLSASLLKSEHLEVKKGELLGDMANKNSVQLKYLKEEYEETHKSQMKIREDLAKILALQGSEKLYLKSIAFKGKNVWELIFQAPSKESVDVFLKGFTFKFSEQTKDGFLYRVEM